MAVDPAVEHAGSVDGDGNVRHAHGIRLVLGRERRGDAAGSRPPRVRQDGGGRAGLPRRAVRFRLRLRRLDGVRLVRRDGPERYLGRHGGGARGRSQLRLAAHALLRSTARFLLQRGSRLLQWSGGAVHRDRHELLPPALRRHVEHHPRVRDDGRHPHAGGRGRRHVHRTAVPRRHPRRG
jgi:hypothetical protein